MRHLISGIDCAIAGAAIAAAPATPIPVALIKSRRFMEYSPGTFDLLKRLLDEAWLSHSSRAWNIPTANSIANLQRERKSPAFIEKTGLFVDDLRRNQPRV